MTPEMLRCVLGAVAEGQIPGEVLVEMVEAIGREARTVEEAVGRLCPEAPPPADDPLRVVEGDEGAEGAGDVDELGHLFEALRACADERGACLLLMAAVAADWGVDPELFTGVDAEEVVDELLAAGDADEAAELALAGAEALARTVHELAT